MSDTPEKPVRGDPAWVAPALTREEQLVHVRRGVGKSGANPDYVLSTQAHLVEMGVHDALLDWLADQLRG